MTTHQDLSSKAMLVKLSISQWTARKHDKGASREIQANHNATDQAGRYNKNLVSKAALQTIQKTANAARTFHYENSLPWNDSGFRILPSANFIKYSDGMRQFNSDFQNAVNEFCNNYPSFVWNARSDLGSLFNPSDYPPESEIASKYQFETEFQPMPSANDFRVSLRQSDVDNIKRNIESKVSANIETANRDLWNRLFTAVSHMSEKLNQTDSVFRDSLVNNLCELCDLLPALNLTGDPKLEDMRREIETRLCQFEPQQLRDNASDRKTAAQEADAIAALMSSYMGGN